MINTNIATLLLNRPNNTIDGSIISTEQIKFLISILDSVIKQKVEGDVVEFGCYVGESSKYLRMMLDYHLSDKKLYVYDSFEGLPPLSKYEINTGWQAGTLKTTQDVLLKNFENNGLKSPIITKGWFKEVTTSSLPSSISFGFLDGDFYDSIYDSLKLTYPLLSRGGCLLFHDYERDDLPGVKAAVIDYLYHKKLIEHKDYILIKIYDQLGLMIKL